MSPARTRAIIKKETKQLLRDRKFLFVLFFFPVFLLVIFGYAVNYDVKNITIAVYDQSKSEESREYVNGIIHSEYFNLIKYVNSQKEINETVDKGEVQAVIVFPKDFSKNIYSSGTDTKIQIIIDGLNGNTASIIKNYITLATYNFNSKLQTQFLAKVGRANIVPIQIESRFLFNPELKTTKFLVPGLIGFILIISAIISVSLSLVREKERGTIEQINVSSIQISELLIGKSFPYLIISLVNAVLVLLAGYLLFDVQVQGSYWLLLLSTLIFLAASTAAGIFISTISDSQQIAFTIATFFSLLPSLIFSGFIFPIESMPAIIQIFTNISPVKFYLVALRAIILRGVGLEAFWDQLIYLLIFMFVFLVLATIADRKKRAAN